MSDYRYNNVSDDVNISNPDLNPEGDHLIVATNLYVLLFVLWPLAIVTILGNALAVWAYATDSKIRSKISNRYIFYLSISDLTVGCVSLPLNNVWLHFGRWPLGEVMCKAWLVVDYASCYISVLAILLLSFDRFLWVSWPMRYKRCHTGRKATILIVSTALFAFLFYTIPILFWSTWVGESQIDYSVDCETENRDNVIYGAMFALFETILPALAISILNIIVYYKIRKVCRSRKRSLSGIERSKSEIRKQRTLINQELQPNENLNSYPRNSKECDTLNPSADHIETTSDDVAMDTSKSTRHARRKCRSIVIHANSRRVGCGSNHDRNDRYVNGYRKAGKMLSCMVGVFMFCWTPFNIAFLASAICANNCIRNVTWEAVNYLLWANSAVNPLLYVLTNERYKRRMLSVFRLKTKFKLSTST